jgi:hypothetical protein
MVLQHLDEALADDAGGAQDSDRDFGLHGYYFGF